MTTRAASSKRKADWIAQSFGDFSQVNQQRKSRKTKIKKAESREIFEIDDQNSWIDKYQPKIEDELAVHKKKIQEVKSWIEESLKSPNKFSSNVLLLTGPAGCGKTATVKVLKDVFECELKEWINPLMQEFNKDRIGDYSARQESQSQLFHDFLLRANRYRQLNLGIQPAQNMLKKNNTLILVEDIPNFLLFDPSKMHTILRKYTTTGKCPLVFIVSDTNTDNFMNSLFPKNLQQELRITNISFNPVALTSLTKTMTKLLNQESDGRSDINIPSKDILDMLATSSNGDVRSCINSLQFYCTDSSPVLDKPKQKSKQKNKAKSSSNAEKEKVKKVAGCIGEKDTSLFLFRALGKILYSKRDTTESDAEKQLPKQLKKSHTRKCLLVDPEDVFERTQTSSDNFLLYLHQNYPEFFADIDDLDTASNYFSDADVMSGVWTSRNIMADYSVSVAARGIMFTNMHTSKGSGTSSQSSFGGGVGFRPIHKPQWFDNTKTLLSREKAGREIFKGSRYARNVLFTEILPHVGMYTNTTSLIHEIASFPVNRQRPIITKPLSNSEKSQSGDEFFELLKEDDFDNAELLNDAEEMLIEDFDD